jgi:glycosyltransferase involved in cell wall biosynthesis
MTVHLWHLALRVWVVQAWIVAGLWVWKSLEAAIGLPKVSDLAQPKWDKSAATGPALTVIVPALNEVENIAACLESLLAQEYQPLRILAVDDRSTDGTGDIMDAIAARHPDRLKVLHVTELPDGWLGKTHAMASAARDAASEGAEYLLFTDADIVFRSDALRRSMAYAVASDADHLVTLPTLVLKRWDEAALLGFFQVCAMWASRPWRVADPKAKRDAVGVGAFNLLRREAYEQVGGFEALRMAIVEDVGMARRVKAAGLRQRVAFGRDLVRVHWATGAFGVVNVLTKNMFSAFGFRIPVLLGACVWLLGFCVIPAAVFAPALLLPAILTAASITWIYRALRKHSGISAWNAALVPFAALLLIYALLRSMVATLRQGGVMWRGTFYPLAELRKHAAPLW